MWQWVLFVHAVQMFSWFCRTELPGEWLLWLLPSISLITIVCLPLPRYHFTISFITSLCHLVIDILTKNLLLWIVAICLNLIFVFVNLFDISQMYVRTLLDVFLSTITCHLSLWYQTRKTSLEIFVEQHHWTHHPSLGNDSRSQTIRMTSLTGKWTLGCPPSHLRMCLLSWH